MLVKSKAILLKKIKYGEKNLILQTFTRETGPQAYFLGSSLLKGKSKVGLSNLGIYSIVARKGKGDLLRVLEMELAEKNFNLISNLVRSSIVLFLNEVILNVIREYDTDIELFDFISNSLIGFNKLEESNVNFHLKFMAEFSRHLGFYPNGQYTEELKYFDLYEGSFVADLPVSNKFIEPKIGRLFSQTLDVDISESQLIKMSNQDRKTLLNHIIEYYRIHIEGFDELKSTDILETVLS